MGELRKLSRDASEVSQYRKWPFAARLLLAIARWNRTFVAHRLAMTADDHNLTLAARLAPPQFVARE